MFMVFPKEAEIDHACQYLQGSGIMWNRYDFPVFLLSENSTLILQEVVYC